MTETITDDVFCGVCRTSELKQANAILVKEINFYKEYAGAQVFMSDFQNADKMRLALIYTRELVESLKAALAHSMYAAQPINRPYEEVLAYVNQKFTIESVRNTNNEKNNNTQN
jgi:hypothetical protein